MIDPIDLVEIHYMCRSQLMEIGVHTIMSNHVPLSLPYLPGLPGTFRTWIILAML